MRGTWLVTVAMMGTAAGMLAAQEHEGHNHDMAMAPADSSSGGRTPLYDNLGTYHMAITTRSPVAQKYFDQGLRLTYGFNHDEAIKSYTEGTREDSTCAMCWWGIAYALGPNINVPMDTAAVRPAWAALQQAVRLAPGVSPREQAYIKALEARYVAEPAANRAAAGLGLGQGDRRGVPPLPEGRRRRHAPRRGAHGPAAVELLEQRGQAAAPRARWSRSTILERVTKRQPEPPGRVPLLHPRDRGVQLRGQGGALRRAARQPRARRRSPGPHADAHLHAARPLGRGGRAQRDARCTWTSSISTRATRPACIRSATSPTTITSCGRRSSMLGRSAEALAAARTIVEKVPADVVRMIPPFEYYSPVVLFTLARFSRWDDVLAEPAPAAGLRYTTGDLVLRARTGLRGEGQADSAAGERATAWRAIAAKTPPEQMANLNSSRALLQIAERHLAGRHRGPSRQDRRGRARRCAQASRSRTS